tara:strand:- start:1575 stop:2279 length:705 start_codon:yes stop_codon:yes gene_type:complete
MRHNILTVANEDYRDFLVLFVNSLFEFADLSNTDTVYVYDTGLSIETKKYINHFPKIKIVDAGFSADSQKIHDEGWKKNTYSKTKFLKQILVETRTPTFMIDSDSIIVQSFVDLADINCDVIGCKRARPGFSQYIGSFFGAINIDKSLDFLDKWIDNIDMLQNTTDLKHCESPALAKTIQENNFNVQDLPEQIVSAVFPTKESRLMHLKSDHYALTVKDRLNLEHAKPFTQRYL